MTQFIVSVIRYGVLDLILDGDSITTEMVMHYLMAGTNMYHRVDPK